MNTITYLILALCITPSVLSMKRRLEVQYLHPCEEYEFDFQEDDPNSLIGQKVPETILKRLISKDSGILMNGQLVIIFDTIQSANFIGNFPGRYGIVRRKLAQANYKVAVERDAKTGMEQTAEISRENIWEMPESSRKDKR